MTVASMLIVVLVMACVVLAMTQFAELPGAAVAAIAVVLAIALALTGDLASQTSLAELNRYLSDPARRLDLSALLLLEALLFGSQAAAVAQGNPSAAWRRLGYLPPPSLVIALFMGQVLVMLAIDGADYGLVAWTCAAVFGAGLAAATFTMRWLLPSPTPRAGLRTLLYAVQAVAGLWLARPEQVFVETAGPPMFDRLIIVVGITAVVVTLGWVAQRLSILEK